MLNPRLDAEPRPSLQSVTERQFQWGRISNAESLLLLLLVT